MVLKISHVMLIFAEMALVFEIKYYNANANMNGEYTRLKSTRRMLNLSYGDTATCPNLIDFFWPEGTIMMIYSGLLHITGHRTSPTSSWNICMNSSVIWLKLVLLEKDVCWVKVILVQWVSL